MTAARCGVAVQEASRVVGGGSADLRLRWRRRVRFFFHFQRIFE